MNLYDVIVPDLGYAGLIVSAKSRPCAEQRLNVGLSNCDMEARFGCAQSSGWWCQSSLIHVCVRLCARIIYRGSREATVTNWGVDLNKEVSTLYST